MTDKTKTTLSAAVDAGMKIATGVILLIVGLVANSLAEFRTDMNDLQSSVNILEAQMENVQANSTKFQDFLQWWYQSMPALDATQTALLKSLSEKVAGVSHLSDRMAVLEEKMPSEIPPQWFLDKVQRMEETLKELQRK